MSAKALFDTVNGRAVFFEDMGKKLYILEVDKPCNLQEASGLQPYMYLQPAMNEIFEIQAGEYPYSEAVKMIDLEFRKHKALECFLRSFDPDLDSAYRKFMWTRAEQLFVDQIVFEKVREVFLEVPMPDESLFDVCIKEGKAGTLMQEMLSKFPR